ncbi:MAG: cytochrome c-type biogenesis protein CcmH [Deltaproteobacteria bacterium]
MKKRLHKIVFSLVSLSLIAGVHGYLDLSQKVGLSLFSKGDKCSTVFCGIDSGLPPIPNLAYADVQGEVEEAIMCQCGCGIVLKHCPHQNCGYAIPARRYIADLVKNGKGKEEIIAIFVKRDGQKVLAAPKKEGFNLLGYILPFIALLGAAFFVSRVIKSWTSRGMREEEKVLEHLPEDKGSELDKKIEEELKKLD